MLAPFPIYEIFDVGEEDHLNLLKNANENDYPLPKRPLINHEPIDAAILYTLEKSPGKS